MPTPRILQDYSVSADGRVIDDFLASVGIPDMTEVTETYDNAGQIFGEEIALAYEIPIVTLVLDEYNEEVFSLYGLTTNAKKQFTIRGSLENDAGVTPHLIQVTGRIKSITRGDVTNRQKNQATVTITCTEYKETIGGRAVWDIAKNKLVVDGVDQLAARNAALGRNS